MQHQSKGAETTARRAAHSLNPTQVSHGSKPSMTQVSHRYQTQRNRLSERLRTTVRTTVRTCRPLSPLLLSNSPVTPTEPEYHTNITTT
ncbi:hypothetical protein KC19_3G254700 [Ceratodon purpureus]|uniref:Uncharacterized protein n=1 Tax=Ceratodon purpureus TaxID=3225 RepID=A0A8T0IPE4_CERPU|nr:hypothetical protein KC19_3G254700 [Ceratodon purpureus]